MPPMNISVMNGLSSGLSRLDPAMESGLSNGLSRLDPQEMGNTMDGLSRLEATELMNGISLINAGALNKHQMAYEMGKLRLGFRKWRARRARKRAAKQEHKIEKIRTKGEARALVAERGGGVRGFIKSIGEAVRGPAEPGAPSPRISLPPFIERVLDQEEKREEEPPPKKKWLGLTQNQWLLIGGGTAVIGTVIAVSVRRRRRGRRR